MLAKMTQGQAGGDTAMNRIKRQTESCDQNTDP